MGSEMARVHLFEIHDQSWCPRTLRDAMTEYLRHVEWLGDIYGSIAPRLSRALQASGESAVVDLCSGGGGPWLRLHGALREAGVDSTVCLTDRYPNELGLAEVGRAVPDGIEVHPEPVDATAVPECLTGFRTLFSSFHHFRPGAAREILESAVRGGRGIGIFEATQRHPLQLLWMCFVPLVVLALTPWIRPFRWSRLVWTYLVPVVPLAVMFDGFVSCLRTYSVAELRDLTRGLEHDGFHWEIGIERPGSLPIGITYAIGYPSTGQTEPTGN